MCKKCNDNGWVEVDPISPEQAETPQYVRCECMEFDEADMTGCDYEDR